jgi:glycosyltransferase involved in cell wall biosynthesis
MLGRVAAKLAGVPVLIHTFHGHVFHSYFSPLKTSVFLWIERILARLTNAIITVSPKQREEILAYGIGHPGKVRAIDFGLELQGFVDAGAVRSTVRQTIGLASDVPLVGIIGRLAPVKGHVYFLEAAQQVLQQHADVHFAIIGDGELRQALERQAAALGITEQIHFLGFLPNSPAIFTDLDLVVLSSLNEGTPVTLIEAMAAGKPVVATSVGGVSDLVAHERTGLLVPSKDSTALADGILRILALSAEERMQMGENGRASVYPKYHIATLVKNIEALYTTLLARLNR